MLYLASPYTSPLAELSRAREGIRFAETLYVTALLTSRGKLVLSPIVLGHTMDQFMRQNSLPRPGYDWWMLWSQELLEMCDSLYVLCSVGWRESRGITQEIRWARDNSLPIVYIDGEANVIDDNLIEEEE